MSAQGQVELLLVAECPHADAARALLHECLTDLDLDIPVVERVGDYLSPTIVVGGRDVMTDSVPAYGVPACRVDIPTVERVRRALRDARTQATSATPEWSDTYPPELAVGVARDRITAVSAAARRLHGAILRAFAATGAPPDPAWLATPGDDVVSLLAELHDHDVIRLDERGHIRVAYPFSGVPTAHTVAIDGGPRVYAMCAIDALGLAAMLGRDITITSADPSTGQPISVEIRDGSGTWSPESTAVFVGSRATASAVDGLGRPPEPRAQPSVAPVADRCCTVMNFFAGTDTAVQWQAAHPDVSGVILTQGQALRLGTDIFGDLLPE